MADGNLGKVAGNSNEILKQTARENNMKGLKLALLLLDDPKRSFIENNYLLIHESMHNHGFIEHEPRFVKAGGHIVDPTLRTREDYELSV